MLVFVCSGLLVKKHRARRHYDYICPACGSSQVVDLMLEHGAAKECVDCGHWGYVK